MDRKIWASEQRKSLIYINSYDDGVMKGRFCDPEYGIIPFKSLSQFLLSMDQILNEKQSPQDYTKRRIFGVTPGVMQAEEAVMLHPSSMATFEMRILFRQNTSWQGNLHWRERNMEQSFRSVLELVMLLDSALRAE